MSIQRCARTFQQSVECYGSRHGRGSKWLTMIVDGPRLLIIANFRVIGEYDYDLMVTITDVGNSDCWWFIMVERWSQRSCGGNDFFGVAIPQYCIMRTNLLWSVAFHLQIRNKAQVSPTHRNSLHEKCQHWIMIGLFNHGKEMETGLYKKNDVVLLIKFYFRMHLQQFYAPCFLYTPGN